MEAEEIFPDETRQSGVRRWKAVIVTGLIVFAFMLTNQVVESATSEQFKYVPIITPLFNFPPHIFKIGKPQDPARKPYEDPDPSFFTPLLQFIIMVTIFVALTLLVIFM